MKLFHGQKLVFHFSKKKRKKAFLRNYIIIACISTTPYLYGKAKNKRVMFRVCKIFHICTKNDTQKENNCFSSEKSICFSFFIANDEKVWQKRGKKQTSRNKHKKVNSSFVPSTPNIAWWQSHREGFYNAG